MIDPTESLAECLARVRLAHSILTEGAPHARIAALGVLDTAIRDLDVLAARAEMPETAALADMLRAQNERERAAKALGEEAESRRVSREDRLRALGFEEPSEEQRREQLARSVAMRDWPQTAALVDQLAADVMRIERDDALRAENAKLRNGMLRALDGLQDALADRGTINGLTSAAATVCALPRNRDDERRALTLAADAVQEECHKAEGSVVECERDNVGGNTAAWYGQIASRLRRAEADLRERASREPAATLSDEAKAVL